LKVVADTRDGDSESWGRLMEWPDRNGVMHRWAMPMEMMAGDGTTLRETLLRGGLRLGGPSKRQLLMLYIQMENPKRFVTCVPHVGWHGGTYVLPDSSISSDGAEEIIYQTATRGEHFYKTAGTLEDWRERLGRFCAGNSRLVFAVSAAFAGPLLRLLNIEGGGFHLVGTSSSGKSTAQWVAGSVCGGGNGAHGFVRSWRATVNALESMAELHNDCTLMLDELREIPDPRSLEQEVYLLANGSGKARMNKAMTAQRTLHWRLLLLSSGEIKLSEYAESIGQRIKGGAEVRLINIPADAGTDMGLFEEIHGAQNPRAFAEKLKAAATKTYGTPLQSFLAHLVRDREAKITWAAAFVDDFTRRALPPDAASEVGRALQRIAAVAAAGEMATAMEITGWEPGEAQRAALRCFQDWIKDRGGVGQADVETGIRQVRHFFEINGSSHFQSVSVRMDSHGDVIEERIPCRAGYWRDEDDRRLYLVLPEVWKRQVCAGFDARLIATVMAKRGFLIKGDGKNFTKKERTPIGSLRFYVVSSRILEEA
jgi:uncharacterized protein (DUF927 family)